jgi:cytochrome bd-type quinol oxidase subunit 2
VVALCATYGAVFVALKTTGRIRLEARELAGRVGIGAVVLGAAFLVWTMLAHGDALVWVLGLGTALPLVLAYQAWTYWVFRRRIGRGHIPTTPQHGAAPAAPDAAR